MSDGFRGFNELPPPPSARSAKPVRLRLACDACTTAKVRCSRTHPCERCEDNGQEKECYYSASRRHGKRARHRKNASVETQLQRSPSSSDTIAAATAVTTSGSGLESVSVSDFTWTDYNISGYSALNEFEVLDGWNSQVDVTVDYNDLNTISWIDPWRSLAFGPDSSPSGSSGMLSPDLSLYTDPVPPITPPDPATAINMDTLKQPHDCEAMALKLLRSLHCNDQTSEYCKQAHSTQVSCQMPSIDTVLSVNKAALTNLTPLLKCACARNPHIAMLHSAILSKVIFWYRVAVSARYHTESVALQPVKIQLGVLDLDEEDQATLQRTVLLRELGKAERVLDTFDSCYRQKNETPNWHTSAVNNMRQELQAVVERMKKGHGDIS